MATNYVIASLNVESAHTQFDKIVGYDAEADHPPDILTICEHRILEKDMTSFTKKFAEHGWNFYATPAVAENGRAHAGVAILTRSGLRCHLHPADLPKWQHCGRFVAGSIVAPSGKHLFELATLYGYADPGHHRQEQQSLFDDVAEWLTSRHSLPLALLGDLKWMFNTMRRLHTGLRLVS